MENRHLITRRKFVHATGLGVAAMALSPRFAFAGESFSDRKVRIGIIGGNFGTGFYFHEHPACIVEAVSDLIPERRDNLMKVYKCSKSYESLEILIKDPKVEAVFIATPAPDHARHVIASLEAGKHVLCAVPAAMTLGECNDILHTVRKTGLIYMMAETTFFRQGMISARKMFKEGLMGNLFSAAAQYNHPGLESLFFYPDGKPTWRHGLPPMHYPTHCTAFLVGLNGDRLTEVCCQGWGDDSPIVKKNRYNNPFWNESAFFKTRNGISFPVEVNWKGALRETERGEWHGDKMSFILSYGALSSTVTVKAGEKISKDDGGFEFKESLVEEFNQPLWYETDMLPEPLRHDSGHGGSHTFITHEFIDSVARNRKPLVDIYDAIAFTAPGIVAHKSALKGGKLMKIPQFDV
jgi:predicted dehydrogenase